MALPVTSGLILHHDATAIAGLSDGDPMSSWDDLSGNSNHATQATPGNRPTYKTGIINGLPVVRFNGTTSEFSTPIALSDGAQSLFFVVRSPAQTDRSLSVLLKAPFIGAGWRENGTQFMMSGANAGSSDTHSVALYVNDAPNLLSVTRSGTGSSSVPVLRVNQQLAAVVAGSRFGNATAQSIGARDGGDHYNGDIAEMLVYDRELSSSEVEDVEQYLYDKWFGDPPDPPSGGLLRRRRAAGHGLIFIP